MGEEAIERLFGEIRRLHDKLDALERRLAGLEARLAPAGVGAAAPVGSWPAQRADPAPDGAREGAFGPRVLRCQSGGHQRAVERALAMLGAARGVAADRPVAGTNGCEAERAPDPGTIRTLQALQRIRAMQGAGAALAHAEHPDREDPVQVPTDAPPPEAAAARPAPEKKPEKSPEKSPEKNPGKKPSGVDLEGALSIDLDQPALAGRPAPVPKRRRTRRHARDRRGA